MIAVRPVRATLVDNYELAAAGLQAVLRPYAGRLNLVDLDTALRDPASLDVILYEPVHQTPASQEVLRRLISGSQRRAVIYSWRDRADGAAYGSFAGHLSKALPAEELVTAVEALAAGEQVISVRVPVDKGPLKAVAAAGTSDFDLTPREAEILSLVTQGLTNAEIGGRLYLSINSVKTYIRTAYRKIDVSRRAQAVAWGMEHGLAPLSDSDGQVG
ncbi:response regulator transcription factor [Nocardioides sp. TRM66260-LWL]|uniref:helix-turn-helix transcriptional regulator n=1 Tax=Nocardioides sp. TRM66260-LWL TaxID=2874478 RepID=UPI001CC60DF0|nr:response regulator transcription factor [Nocardioides sp. TRM66260-LWL]MBZ5734834.1 response regulator transcription factor [Nocardioides sp. TRM66260-LWL]